MPQQTLEPEPWPQPRYVQLLPKRLKLVVVRLIYADHYSPFEPMSFGAQFHYASKQFPQRVS